MTKKSNTNDLPFDLIESDLKYPKRPKKYNWHKEQPFDVLHTITLYETTRMGWVVCTLHISNPSRRRHSSDAQPRTYGVTSDGKVCRVGLGPHVKRTLTVYVSRGRANALKKLIELHDTGLESAGSIRDRISSRRAQGVMLRSNWLENF
jgi:hypothetical protein